MIVEEKPPFKDGLPPIHPGVFIGEDLIELEMSSIHFDAALAVPAGTTAAVVAAHLDITPELALRLSRYLGTTAQLWMNLQASYDLKIAERKHGDTVAAEVTPLPGVSESPYRKFDDAEDSGR